MRAQLRNSGRGQKIGPGSSTLVITSRCPRQRALLALDAEHAFEAPRPAQRHVQSVGRFQREELTDLCVERYDVSNRSVDNGNRGAHFASWRCWQHLDRWTCVHRSHDRGRRRVQGVLQDRVWRGRVHGSGRTTTGHADHPQRLVASDSRFAEGTRLATQTREWFARPGQAASKAGSGDLPWLTSS
jgi:hypothetical protein